MPRAGNLENIMKGREQGVRHIARVPRPHLAQELRERGQEEYADSLTYMLTPHARMCARGEARPHKRRQRA